MGKIKIIIATVILLIATLPLTAIASNFNQGHFSKYDPNLIHIEHKEINLQ